mgnify:FL=1
MSNRKKVKNLCVEVESTKIMIIGSEIVMSSNGVKVSFDASTRLYGMLAHFVDNYKNGTEEDKTEAKNALITVCGVAFSCVTLSGDIEFIQVVAEYFDKIVNKQEVQQEEEVFGEKEYNKLISDKEEEKNLLNGSMEESSNESERTD